MSQFRKPLAKQSSPKRRRRRWPWIIGIAIIFIIGLASVHGQSSTETSTGSTPTASATQQRATPTPTAVPTAKPTPKPTKAAITHGTPRIGGPISDFYGRYGTPSTTGIGDTPTWIVDQQIINASPDTNGIVHQVNFSLINSKPANQMIAYCVPFLPSGASKFNMDANYIDYQSSIGEVVMQIADGSCVLSTSQS